MSENTIKTKKKDKSTLGGLGAAALAVGTLVVTVLKGMDPKK